MTKQQLRDPGLFGSLYASAEGASLLSSSARVKDAYQSAMNAYNWLGDPNYYSSTARTKPRITKFGKGHWNCDGDGVAGNGRTPKQSYQRWRALKACLTLKRASQE